MTTKSFRGSGTSDLKDMYQSPARILAKLQCSASCEVDGMMSWSSVTSSVVLEEIWPKQPEKLFVDLWTCGMNGCVIKQYNQI